MREYELMFLIRPDIEDDSIPGVIEKVEQLVSNAGGQSKEVVRAAPWGRRRMAYSIAGFQDAFYTLMHLELDPSKMIDLERDLKLSEEIIRYLLTRVGD